MASKSQNKIQSFYRVVRAQRGHPFSGLYAVEKVKYRDGQPFDKQIVHEWDLRIISEAILARLGGQDAYESFVGENPGIDLGFDEHVSEAAVRKPEDSLRKLDAELKLKPEDPEK